MKSLVFRVKDGEKFGGAIIQITVPDIKFTIDMFELGVTDLLVTLATDGAILLSGKATLMVSDKTLDVPFDIKTSWTELSQDVKAALTAARGIWSPASGGSVSTGSNMIENFGKGAFKCVGVCACVHKHRRAHARACLVAWWASPSYSLVHLV